MTRSRRSAKTIGATTERHVADYLAAALEDDRIDRRVKNGSKDRGDVSGVRVHGQRLVVETKDCTRADIPGWIRESHIEAAHDDALCGITIAKRRGTRDVGSYYVHMEVRDLIALITGERQDGCYE